MVGHLQVLLDGEVVARLERRGQRVAQFAHDGQGAGPPDDDEVARFLKVIGYGIAVGQGQSVEAGAHAVAVIVGDFGGGAPTGGVIGGHHEGQSAEQRAERERRGIEGQIEKRLQTGVGGSERHMDTRPGVHPHPQAVEVRVHAHGARHEVDVDSDAVEAGAHGGRREVDPGFAFEGAVVAEADAADGLAVESDDHARAIIFQQGGMGEEQVEIGVGAGLLPLRHGEEEFLGVQARRVGGGVRIAKVGQGAIHGGGDTDVFGLHCRDEGQIGQGAGSHLAGADSLGGFDDARLGVTAHDQHHVGRVPRRDGHLHDAVVWQRATGVEDGAADGGRQGNRAQLWEGGGAADEDEVRVCAQVVGELSQRYHGDGQPPGGDVAESGGHGKGRLQFAGGGLVGDDQRGRIGDERVLEDGPRQNAEVGRRGDNAVRQHELRVGAHHHFGLLIEVAVDAAVQNQPQRVALAERGRNQRFGGNVEGQGAVARSVEQDGGD